MCRESKLDRFSGKMEDLSLGIMEYEGRELLLMSLLIFCEFTGYLYLCNCTADKILRLVEASIISFVFLAMSLIFYSSLIILLMVPIVVGFM